MLGFTFAANRVLAFAAACVILAAVWIVLERTRFGPRSVRWRSTRSAHSWSGSTFAASRRSHSPAAAPRRDGRDPGQLFLSFNPAIGIEFTMKALVVVIMGGIGNMLVSLAAALLLGVARRCVLTMSIPD